jgi:hypothetical protein
MVEIISPSNSADEVIDKVDEYFRAGTRLVWVIYPNAQRVYVYTLPTDVTAIDNLVVDDFHTYFVGRPGLLVHNPAARRRPCRPVCMCHRRRNGLAAGSLFASRPLFGRHFVRWVIADCD